MSSFDDWSQIISKYLQAESAPLASLGQYALGGNAARTAFTSSVLDRFLPEIYGVGSGQIIDSEGNCSEHMDIVIYRRDFPRFDLSGNQAIYLYESVIATVDVTVKLVKKNCFDALDRSAALASLKPDVNAKALDALAARNQLTRNEDQQYIHPSPLKTARFSLIARPISFIYAFSGYKTSPRQLAETIEAWIAFRNLNGSLLEMKSLPAVIATQGCFACRNSGAFALNKNFLMSIGADRDPVRLIVLQILQTLSRRLRFTTDSFGLKPGLDRYLKQMSLPEIERYIGKAQNPLPSSTAMQPSSAQSKFAQKETPTLTSASAKPAPLRPLKDTALKAADQDAIKAKPSAVTTNLSMTGLDVKRPGLGKQPSLNPKPEAVDAPFPVPNADLIPELSENSPVEHQGKEPDMPLDTDLGLKTKKPEVVHTTESPKNPEDWLTPPPKTPLASLNGRSNGASSTKPAKDYMQTIKIKASEPVPDLQPDSEPPSEPFISTIPQ